MIKYISFVALIFFVLLVYFSMNNLLSQNKATNQESVAAAVRYIAIGDSYTVGEGVAESESYPVLLTEHLRKEGVDIVLVANPSVTGYTTQDAIVRELPELTATNANFATVLIGANDVLAQDTEEFRRNYTELLDKLQKTIPGKYGVVVFTIPDFSVTPRGGEFGYLRSEIKRSIMEFNSVIKTDAEKRGMTVVDLFAITSTLVSTDMVVADGLHPAAKQYALWEKAMFPKVYTLLKEKYGK